MKTIIPTTAVTLASLTWEWRAIDKQILVQNISANDIFMDNKEDNVLTEWYVLKSWNELFLDLKNTRTLFVQAGSNSEIRFIFQ